MATGGHHTDISFYPLSGIGYKPCLPIAMSHVDTSGADIWLEGGKTVIVLDNVQNHFGYFLVVIPKAIMFLCGNVLTPWFWFTS
jgi:hypothetical protein